MILAGFADDTVGLVDDTQDDLLDDSQPKRKTISLLDLVVWY